MNDKESNTRLDIEIYVMGEMKFEFINFLSECYKDDFVETLSWGNFKRFQLILYSGNKWLNVYFIFIKNDINADILINSFKIYEKRNFTLLLYNIHDQKSERNIDGLYEGLIFERNKFYEGILNEDSINENLAKINPEDEVILSPEDVKGRLKFLTENEDNLIFKVGFSPLNKKVKGQKRDSITTYTLSNELFYIDDQDGTNFVGLLNYILSKHFEIFMMDNESEKYFEIVVNKSENKVVNKSTKGSMSYFVKVIDLLIAVYIIACFYKFLFLDNI